MYSSNFLTGEIYIVVDQIKATWGFRVHYLSCISNSVGKHEVVKKCTCTVSRFFCLICMAHHSSTDVP